MTFDDLVRELHSLANPANVAGMARFGINPANNLGISVADLRKLARGLHDHALAQQLWDTGIHEARILAALIDVPAQVDEEQMERWALDFDSWDICDQVCFHLFDRTPYAVPKAYEWSTRPEEFVKRAAFVLIASLAVHNKKAPDELFLGFFPVIRREAGDGRNFVKKAVNWALRSIGKRNPDLRLAAIDTARQIQQDNPSPAARWVAVGALRELSV